ncbi:MAG: hypothetical protein Kow0080_02790 [Candidatus Promineifilaceae bacterium]
MIFNKSDLSLQTHWHPYREHYTHPHPSVTGHLLVAPSFYSPQLDNRRDIVVYLPPSYATGNGRYPVLYMQDGQNLFDNTLSFSGEWQVDETMEQLSQEEGLEAIVVGIANGGAQRLNEYSPFQDKKHGGGKGDQYLQFVVNTLKPIIDESFRTLPEQAHTGIIGSSMGGLISLYAFFRYPQTFGFTGVMSPSLWFADDAILHYVEKTAVYHPGKIYLDAGTRELGDSWQNTLLMKSRRYYGRVRRLKRILVYKGYRPIHELLHMEGKNHRHQEWAWALRLPNAIRFFLRGNIRP